jgi:hypothetical protein
LCPDGKPNANFTGALANETGKNPIDSHARKQDGYAREYRKQKHQESRPRERFGQHVIHHLYLGKRYVIVLPGNSRFDGGQ